LIAADATLAYAAAVPAVLAGVALWGLHMGLTQGLLAAMIASAAPSHLRGTAFGVFNLITGLVLLAASVVAGMLWSRYGAFATFTAGALFSGLTLPGLAAYAIRRK
jgi:Na+/H+ antiporter NhaC